MKIIITLLLALFISGQAYSNPYRGSDIGLNYGCTLLEDLATVWVERHLKHIQDQPKQAQEALEFAKEYSTIYKDLDCREVLRQE